MPIIHYLNVKQGDCSIIEHLNGHLSVIDVFNAYVDTEKKNMSNQILLNSVGNHNQKDYPVNPLEYLKSLNKTNVFRFILTHPDMDHMGGIKTFFEKQSVANFWDTNNKKEMGSFDGSPYNEDDWKFYKNLREGKESVKRLNLYSGDTGQYFNVDKNNEPGGDGLYILSPTKELVDEANKSDTDYNMASYVLLYVTGDKKIIFSGDSTNETWEHIMKKHKNSVTNIDLLIAPHHGRDSEMDFSFLDTLNPKLTFFGYAPSKDLAYKEFNKRNLELMTNNECNCMIVEINNTSAKVYCTYETFAKKYNSSTTSKLFTNIKAWYLRDI